MIKSIDTKKQALIVKNVLAACKDINKLNKTGYDYLYNCSGFIAHYDINGFKAHYSNNNLQSDIELFAKQNQWSNFRAGENNADYYHSKRDVYNKILGEFCAHEFIKNNFTIIHIKGEK